MLSNAVLHEFHNPHRNEAMPDADAIGQAGAPGEGPFLTLFLKLEDGIVRDAAFQTYGCPSAIACGSWLTRWVQGRTLQQASVLSADALMRVLGGLPLGKEHAATLAVRALQRALQECELLPRPQRQEE